MISLAQSLVNAHTCAQLELIAVTQESEDVCSGLTEGECADYDRLEIIAQVEWVSNPESMMVYQVKKDASM